MEINGQLVPGSFDWPTSERDANQQIKETTCFPFHTNCILYMKNYSQFSVILQNWLIASHCRPWIDFTIDHPRESCCVISGWALSWLLNCHYSCHFMRTGVTILHFLEVYLNNSAPMVLRKCNCCSLIVLLLSQQQEKNWNEGIGN